ncbi:MAG TPA: poly-gamma-glutamate biosynthesis protein PgsC/CapC, partial [Kofleriaceae bacterium]|nr:poly-gamma-glutamate biosynthesis protein PgsC/CapC [Kofleriaceae bacterium]
MGGHLITLFPPYGIDQTIHVAILIGVLVLLALTECFGWVFSGLIVPGYLASLFVLAPASGATVVFEAVLTYLLATLISNAVPRSGAWSPFFGRERFLLLIFISIAVRQASELWLVPEGMRLVDDQLGTAYRLTHTFSSVGLVLVPLTANMFWKLDLRRGLLQVAVPTALTFALLHYVLLPYTNLSFARLEITYENVALDFMASPKAYILLIIGAWLASRWNLLYGWDYAGILVPALLGLAWLSPARLATTLVETLVLVMLVRGLVLAPGLRTMNLEGPRKVALVFAVSFLLKWSLGWVLGPTVSDLRITDLFGFGYLLSSLLAVKILQKDAIAQIAVPTVVVSVLTLAIGSAVGF